MVFDLSIEIGYYIKGTSVPKVLKVQLNKKEQIFTIPVNGLPEKIVVDPNNKLLSSIYYTN